MEIQDRNIMAQQVMPQKLNLFQSSDPEGVMFADILKSSIEEKNIAEPRAEVNLHKAHEKGVETKPLDVKKTLPEKNTTETKKTISEEKASEPEAQKMTDKDKKQIKEEARSDPQEKTIQNKSPEEKVSEKALEEGETDSGIDVKNEQTVSQGEEETNVVIDGMEMANDLLLGLPVFVQEESAKVEDVVPEEENLISMPIEAELPVEMQESQSLVSHEHHVKLEDVAEEAPQVMTKEELVLNEQARYLDEKVSFGKKLKVDVDVKEEKVAASISKDVLKNRFEIDSLIQSVDMETQEFFEEKAPLQTIEKPLVHQEQVLLQDNLNIAPVVENEVNLQQFEPVAVKETEVAAVNTENVAETTKVFRQEILTRTNDVSSRDNVRGMGKEVVEQIKINITKSAIKGVDTVEIQLKPEDLGRIQIKMHIAKDGKLHADIVASRAETLDMLQKESSSLAEAFNNAGYEADGKSFSFSFQKGNQSEGQQNSKELAHFLGEKIEEERTSFENDNFSYDPLKGLNIRV